MSIIFRKYKTRCSAKRGLVTCEHFCFYSWEDNRELLIIHSNITGTQHQLCGDSIIGKKKR